MADCLLDKIKVLFFVVVVALQVSHVVGLGHHHDEIEAEVARQRALW